MEHSISPRGLQHSSSLPPWPLAASQGRVRSAHDREERAASLKATMLNKSPSATGLAGRNLHEVMEVRQSRVSWTTDELQSSGHSPPGSKNLKVIGVSVWSSTPRVSTPWPNDAAIPPPLIQVHSLMPMSSSFASGGCGHARPFRPPVCVSVFFRALELSISTTLAYDAVSLSPISMPIHSSVSVVRCIPASEFGTLAAMALLNWVSFLTTQASVTHFMLLLWRKSVRSPRFDRDSFDLMRGHKTLRPIFLF